MSGCVARHRANGINLEACVMPLKKGERYRCPDRNCGCEIEVTKSAPANCKGNMNPRCCCGKEMERVREGAKDA